MIALVRSVASKTKQLCACALLNLVSEDNTAALKEAGATRVFAAISSSPQAAAQHICAQGFLLFSATATRRDDLVTRRPVLQSLFNMVRCSSARSRVLVGMTICNLLACPSSQKSAIHGGALSVFKLIATQDFEELKEASARTIISLGQSPGVLFSLPQHPLVPLLVMILHSSRSFTFDCALSALACLAHTQMFRAHMISEGAVVGLVEAVLAGRIVSVQAATEVVRCLYFLSYVQEKMEYMTVKCHFLLALHVLYKVKGVALFLFFPLNFSVLTSPPLFQISQPIIFARHIFSPSHPSLPPYPVTFVSVFPLDGRECSDGGPHYPQRLRE